MSGLKPLLHGSSHVMVDMVVSVAAVASPQFFPLVSPVSCLSFGFRTGGFLFRRPFGSKFTKKNPTGGASAERQIQGAWGSHLNKMGLSTDKVSQKKTKPAFVVDFG